jgi:branched-chain amino acid transport system permease protein
VQALLDGSFLGTSYVIVALGFTLIFGVLGILNVAHADFYMVGAYVSLYVLDHTGHSLWVALATAVATGVILGTAFYFVVVRRVAAEQQLAVFVATIGLSIFLENFVARIAGPDDRAYPQLVQSNYYRVSGVVVTKPDLALLGATLLLSGGLLLWLRFTGLGSEVRAVAESRFLAAALGINVRRVILTAVVIASVIACVGGVMVASTYQNINPFLANGIALKMFIVVIIAGAGSLIGAVVVGFGLGITESYAVAYFNSSWQDLISLMLLVLVLLVRPQGLLGQRARVG